MANNIEMLAELNAFRAAEGLAPFADWRKARHLPILESYRATTVDDFEASAEELAAQADRPVAEETAVEETTTDVVAELVAENAKANEKIERVPATKEKGKTYKEVANYEKSTVVKPVEFIHNFLNANPDLGRKAAVIELTEKHGINYSTARTQYQRWFTARKAVAE